MLDSFPFFQARRGRMGSIWTSLAELPELWKGNARRHKLLDVLTIALVGSMLELRCGELRRP